MTTVETLPAATCRRHFKGVNPYSGKDIQLTPVLQRGLFMVLGAFLSLRILAMFLLPMTDTTEARYSEIARKMVETGNWVTPQYDYGVPFWGKPPLHTWLSALGMQLFGTYEAAARLPIHMVSLLMLAVFWVWVRNIAGRNIALVSVSVLFTMAMFFGASAFVMTDMPMTLGTVLVMAGFWTGACRETKSPVWGMMVFVGLAVGLLAKGPVAVVLCIIPLFLWLAVTGNWGALKRLPWRAGLLLLLLLTAPWYIAAERATPGFLQYFLIGEHFNRFLVSGWGGDLYGSAHVQPKGMIWLLWLEAALPWSLVPILFVWRVRRTVQSFTQDRSGWLLYVLAWALAPLILFTPAANILAAYTLPGLPAAALLMTVLVSNQVAQKPGFWPKLGFSTGAGAIFALFAAFVAGLAFVPDRMPLRSHKGLIEAAWENTPGVAIYTVAGRSYSAEFYTLGAAETVEVQALPSLLSQPQAMALAVPNSLMSHVNNPQLTNLGQFGRNTLLLKQETGGAN